ncbi:hypothetical protein JHL17_35330 [Azospirillum sp. YIM B02556]|uniref:Phosphatidate cytidylyltransferase n=1 Tax=Azospirillum endophyticum TaxID=2800326 RepID=A0ABS1FGY6_9PROT|nr:hypothetical protein [Azospirillum endophyticum]MBK1842680.1 hypothetical protein [Azospirillum endophyticum]
MTPPLNRLVAEELDRPVMAEARVIANAILARHGDGVAAVLFYGSCLRTGDTGGLLDVYVLTDDLRRYHGRLWPALLNAALPPTVSYLETAGAAGLVRAKVAVMGTAAFGRAVRGEGIDTTVWARFCQPAALLHARDAANRAAVVEAVAQAVATAARWAVRLGPAHGLPAEYWTALFRHTYGAELRAERSDRATLVHDWAAERYAHVLPLALAHGGIAVTASSGGELHPVVHDRGKAGSAWKRRRRMGKLLNVLRLVKAAFTFDNGVDYILWKLERHVGRPVPISAWQRRHPLLAAPLLLMRLYRDGFIR